MDLTHSIPLVRAALLTARSAEAARIADALRSTRVLGVLGEAEVGKSETIRQAIGDAGLDSDRAVVRLDLDGAASDGHVGFRLVKQLARNVLGPIEFSLLSGDVLVPQRITHRRAELAELLGADGLDEALREWPTGHLSAASAMGAVERLAGRRPVVLWMDHLEAPTLTPRHPLDLQRFLWGVRELLSEGIDLRVVLSARMAAEPDVLGPKAAFHQQGRWLTLDVPAPVSWRQVASEIEVAPGLAERLAYSTGGHPATMQLALLHAAGEPDRRWQADDVLRDLVVRDDGLAGRAVQHARTLHRLGGQVLTQIAMGQRPYAGLQRGSATSQEIRKVLNRLRLAGLLRRSNGWRIVNPLVAMRLRGAVWGPAGIDEEGSEGTPPFTSS